MIRWAAVLAGALAGTQAAPAADCRLALVLAMDVSSSVDAGEDALQRAGLARALLAPEVAAAFLHPPQPVALAVFEWSGRDNQKLLLDWTLIRARADLEQASRALAGSTRSTDQFPTALGHAVGYAAILLQSAPTCIAQTIDVSGDGRNNEGFTPRQAYAHFPFDGVTVNGLAIETAGNSGASETFGDAVMAEYYREHLLLGPNAFVQEAGGFADFERAMRRKLLRELGGAALSRMEQRP